MKNSVYDIKYVNAMNFIIIDLLQPVTRTVLVFYIKWWRNNEKINNDLLLPDIMQWISFLILKTHTNNTKQYKTSRSFEWARKQRILYINTCFRKHVEKNLFNLVHAKYMNLR